MSQDAEKLELGVRPFGAAMGTRANKTPTATAIWIFMISFSSMLISSVDS
jgi:hypothetical protein